MYEFDAGVWVKMDAFNDFWRELPVKKLADQLPGKGAILGTPIFVINGVKKKLFNALPLTNELCHEKTCLQGFRPTRTQTEL